MSELDSSRLKRWIRNPPPKWHFFPGILGTWLVCHGEGSSRRQTQSIFTRVHQPPTPKSCLIRMSSRFVSAGAIDAATGAATSPAAADAAAAATAASNSDSNRKAQEWLEVEKQLEAARVGRQKAAAGADASGSGERSLYEVLQANKAAKQAAFEEANRLRNQFRALDDDEIDFLDGVRARARAEEERVRRETEERLRAFRARQGGAAAGAVGEVGGGERPGGGVGVKASRDGEEPVDEEELLEVGWGVTGKKRRRVERDAGKKKAKGLGLGLAGSKRKAETGGDDKTTSGRVVDGPSGEKNEMSAGDGAKAKATPSLPPTAPPSGGDDKKPGGLVDYGSSEDDDD